MIGEMQTVSSVTFGIPSDFPTLVDSVVYSLEEGNVDYCFNLRQLRQIIQMSHGKNISIIYRIYRNELFNEIDYIKLTPVKFISKLNPRLKLNVQCSFDEIPEEYEYTRKKIINRNSIEITDNANYVHIGKDMEIRKFNEDGTPVYHKKISWKTLQKQNRENRLKKEDNNYVEV